MPSSVALAMGLRIRWLSELLQNIAAVQAMAWEAVLLRRIKRERRLELENLAVSHMWWPRLWLTALGEALRVS